MISILEKSIFIIKNLKTMFFIVSMPLVLSGCMGEAIKNVEERERIEALKVTAPLISLVSPTFSSEAGGGTLTVIGKRLSDVDTLFIGSNACSILAKADTSITCTIPSSTAGNYNVVATDSKGETGQLSSSFDYLAAPTVSAVTNSSGTSAGGDTVTVSGTGFYGVTSVTFNSIACSSFAVVSSTAITCVTPADTAGAAIDVVVTNADGQTGTGSGVFTFEDPFTILSVTSTTVDGSYNSGDIIDVTVNYSGAVTQSSSSLTMDTGGIATYVSGNNSASLVYQYPVTTSQTSADLTVSSVNIGDTVSSSSGITVDGTLPGASNLADNQNIVIDTTAPTIINIDSPSSDVTPYASGTIDIVVTFSETLDTNANTTSLTLGNGATASYISGVNPITYRYTIGSENSLDLNVQTFNAGTVADLAGNVPSTALPVGANLADNKNFIIDTTAPILSNITATTPGNGYYNAGDVIDISLNFNEAVVATTSTITLDTGTVVPLSSGSSTSSLVFQYTVVAETSADLNVANFSPGNAADVVSNAAPATIPVGLNLSDTQNIIIDTTQANITSISSSTANGSYGSGSVVSIDVVFDEVIVATNPTLSLDSGGVASYVSGSNSNTLTFEYTIAATENSTDLSVTVFNIGDALDRAGNTIVTTLPVGQNLADNAAIVVDTTAPIVTQVSSTEADGTYAASAVLLIQVEFDEAVNVDTVGGTPQILLDNGGIATYTSGSGTTTIEFTYTVTAGENSAALDYAATNSLTLESGSIKDLMGNDAVLTLATPNAVNSISDDQSIIIDTTAPTITAVTSTTVDGTYGVGTSIDIVVDFDEPVNVTTVGGTPSISLNSGGAAVYASGDGTSSLTFTYVVAASENATLLDYASTSSLVLNLGTIKDLIGNDAALTLATPNTLNSISDDQSIAVDSAGSIITSITSTVPGDGTYTTTQTVDIIVTFDEAVTTSSSSLTLDNGGVASYLSGSTTTAIVYQYTIAALENSTDLNVSSITIGDAVDGVGNAISPILPVSSNLADNQDILVDTSAPTIQNISSALADGSYMNGQVIDIVVTYSEVVTTSSSSLTLDGGGVAVYQAGSGSATITYRYTVAAENSTDLTVTSVTVGDAVDSVGLAIDTSLPVGQNLADNKAIIIDTTAPTITGITSTHLNGTFGIGEVIDIDVTFDENVNTTAGSLTLDTGASAPYFSGSGSSTITFRYTVAATENSVDLDVSTFVLGDCADVAGNSLDTTLPGANLAASKAIVIDTTAPVITNITSTKLDGTYLSGEVIDIDVTIDKIATTTSSALVLDSGGTAAYFSGSGSTTLTYRYTVAANENSADLTVSSFTAGDSADSIGNPIDSTLPGAANLGDTKNITIDAKAPSITGITSAHADGTFGFGEVINIDVTFDEAVTITSGSLTLDNGATASYLSGSTTATIRYQYTVGLSQDSADLNVTTVNAGNAVDANANAISTVIPAGFNLSDSKAIVIDTSVPTITGITSATADSTYGVTQTIDIDVSFSKAVTATSTVLNLDSTGTASILSGSGTSTITFRYTIGASESSTDLTVSSITVGDAADVYGNVLDVSIPGGSNLGDSKNFVVDSTPPSISSISPQGGQTTGGTSLVITGTGFNPSITATDVTVGGVACASIIYSSSTQLTCTTPTGSGFADVVVTNPNDGQNDTLSNGYLYSSPMTITSISQSTGAVGGGHSVTITGTGFDLTPGILSVKIGPYACGSISGLTATSLTCVTSAGAVGTYDVTLTQYFQTKSLSSAFTYVSGPVLGWDGAATEDWGTTSTNDVIQFTLRNTGSSDSSTISISVTGTNSTYWTIGTDNCSGTVLDNVSPCTVDLVFLGAIVPGGGPYTAVLNATAASGGSATKNLQGSK